MICQWQGESVRIFLHGRLLSTEHAEGDGTVQGGDICKPRQKVGRGKRLYCENTSNRRRFSVLRGTRACAISSKGPNEFAYGHSSSSQKSRVNCLRRGRQA